MMQNGTVYQLLRPERFMLERGFGLSVTRVKGGRHWRTPDANMERGNHSEITLKRRLETKKPLHLNDQLDAVSKGLLPQPTIQYLPTPVASDAAAGSIIGKEDTFFMTKNGTLRRVIKSGADCSLNLARLVTMFPTPKANCGNNACIHGEGGIDLQAAVQWWGRPAANDAKNAFTGSQKRKGAVTAKLAEAAETKGGQLNPEWVEALMGYPHGWTNFDNDTLTESIYSAAWLDGTWEEASPAL